MRTRMRTRTRTCTDVHTDKRESCYSPILVNTSITAMPDDVTRKSSVHGSVCLYQHLRPYERLLLQGRRHACAPATRERDEFAGGTLPLLSAGSQQAGSQPVRYFPIGQGHVRYV